MLDIDTGKPKQIFKFELGNICMVTGGANNGYVIVNFDIVTSFGYSISGKSLHADRLLLTKRLLSCGTSFGILHEQTVA